MITRISLFIVALFLFAGCSSSPNPPIKKDITIPNYRQDSSTSSQLQQENGQKRERLEENFLIERDYIKFSNGKKIQLEDIPIDTVIVVSSEYFNQVTYSNWNILLEIEKNPLFAGLDVNPIMFYDYNGNDMYLFFETENANGGLIYFLKYNIFKQKITHQTNLTPYIKRHVPKRCYFGNPEFRLDAKLGCHVDFFTSLSQNHFTFIISPNMRGETPLGDEDHFYYYLFDTEYLKFANQLTTDLETQLRPYIMETQGFYYNKDSTLFDLGDEILRIYPMKEGFSYELLKGGEVSDEMKKFCKNTSIPRFFSHTLLDNKTGKTYELISIQCSGRLYNQIRDYHNKSVILEIDIGDRVEYLEWSIDGDKVYLSSSEQIYMIDIETSTIHLKKVDLDEAIDVLKYTPYKDGLIWGLEKGESEAPLYISWN